MHESGSYPEGTKGAGDQEIKHNTRYPQHHTAAPHHTTPFAMSGEGSSSAAASGQQSMSSFLPGAPEHLLPPPPPPQLNTTTNIEAAKFTFPAEIPTAVKKAVLSFQPPPGRALHPIKPKKSRSVAVYYGVKLDVVKEAGGGGETALLDVPREPQLPPARRQPHRAAREYNNRSYAALAECPPNQKRGVNNGRRQVRDSSSSGV